MKDAKLKARIEQVLSEILSDMYDCNIKLKFVPKEGKKEEKHESTRTDSIGPIDGCPGRILRTRRARMVGSGAGHGAGHPGRVAG
mgnify:CR=1 FL=1|jgi:hypothetical protein